MQNQAEIRMQSREFLYHICSVTAHPKISCPYIVYSSKVLRLNVSLIIRNNVGTAAQSKIFINGAIYAAAIGIDVMAVEHVHKFYPPIKFSFATKTIRMARNTVSKAWNAGLVP